MEEPAVRTSEIRLEDVRMKEIRDAVLDSFAESYTRLDTLSDSDEEVMLLSNYANITTQIRIWREIHSPQDVKVRVESTNTSPVGTYHRTYGVIQRVGMRKMVHNLTFSFLASFFIILALLWGISTINDQISRYLIIPFIAIMELILVGSIMTFLTRRAMGSSSFPWETKLDLDQIIEHLMSVLSSLRETDRREAITKKCWNCFADFDVTEKKCNNCGIKLQEEIAS